MKLHSFAWLMTAAAAITLLISVGVVRPVQAQTIYTACPLPNYPDATCTGVPAGTALKVVTGIITISTANTVIDSEDIHGCVIVNAPGVIIRNSRIACNDIYAVNSSGYSGTWLLIQDTEIDCNDANGNPTNGTAIGQESVTVLRANIHGCENGFDADRNFLIQDTYIHDMFESAAAHTDGIQMWNTATNVTIQHNRIYSNNGTSAIISPENVKLGTIIRDNLFAGGSYSLYCVQGGPGGQIVVNNHFSTIFYPNVGEFGAWTDCEDEGLVTGNVIHETGKLLPGQNTSVKTPATPPAMQVAH